MSHESRFGNLPLSVRGPMDCALRGTVLLNHSIFNKGSAFPPDERRTFALNGLLPAGEQTLEQQVHRAYEQYSTRADDLAKNTFLTSLHDQNHVLFFRLVQDHLDEMFSVIYTPTEGDAIQNYSRLFRRPEGCFLRIDDIDGVFDALAQWGTAEDIDYIVVTDGEEILGIGDQGVGGVLISRAKLILTTLCAGIHPNRTLGVVLDCGTDNQQLLDDALYLGLRQRRVRGQQYDRFVEAFVRAARHLFPQAYIHFEDFGLDNARRLLDTYRPQMACFNDDVQGTGCVTLAAILSGLHVSGEHLDDLRMVVFGAGSAGVGIADQVCDAIASKKKISRAEAAKQIWLIDKPGLLTTEMAEQKKLSKAQQLFAKDGGAFKTSSSDRNSSSSSIGLLDVVNTIKPNVLVGTSTKPKAFTKDIVQAMASHVDRPIILPLSNPTRLHEAVPSNLLEWTDGRALIATGSPFPPVTGPWGKDGDDVEIQVAECNNSVVFPGIGLGAVLSRASRLSDAMLVAAVTAVADFSPALKDATAPILPGVDNVRPVSVHIARSVIRAAQKEGLATERGIPSEEDGDDLLDEWIREQMWTPEYRPLRYVRMEDASRQAAGVRTPAGTYTRRDSV
ncbi:malate dehydrogenase (oxaloacetate-decarboxylating) [Sporothrix schenckii 1099-18]|uniref:Malic enzyme n=1 Tax=Sporothrix schenckii 1099-18 TaxID=1397361 RepID=A0A0F2MJH4_SPOSC|nr:malate dehydrogenase (oxaloacetate-decarboxylating) [Sporothrix schenckii 1099-18]KJR88975.1 malate dehydrogenase (oxaloacetate-decarboxylating) [Sporothrix schenckii 1099-18]